MKSQASQRRGGAVGGFTLIESVIAIGVVAILLTTFLAVFGPASQSIRRSISVQEADRLQSALEREFQILREGPDDKFETAFEKAFDWILKSGESDSAVLLYNYRGDPTSIRTDGTMEPYPDATGESGVDYVLQPAVRRLGDAGSDLEDDLEAIEGRVYLVRMTQLIYKDGELQVNGVPGRIVDPQSGEPAADADSYPEAVIAFSGEFYVMRTNDYEAIKNLEFTPEETSGLPRPLFSRNMGVRR